MHKISKAFKNGNFEKKNSNTIDSETYIIFMKNRILIFRKTILAKDKSRRLKNVTRLNN
tara:strand:+ start:595 stop:771 length:177 start_codon:yes stop_codon:yes gene_type:complete